MNRAQLEAQLDASPDNTELLIVYADLLQSEGDPRGEMILLEHRLGQEAPLAPIIEANPSLLGPLSGLDSSAYEAHWDFGFIRELTLDAPLDATQLIQHPSFRFLRRLRLKHPDLVLSFKDAPWPSHLIHMALNWCVHKTSLERELSLAIAQLLSKGAVAALENLELIGLPVPPALLDDLPLVHIETLALDDGSIERDALDRLRARRAPHLSPLDAEGRHYRSMGLGASVRFTCRGSPRYTDLSCSFCRASQEKVGKLIAGPAVHICDRCINRCASMLENAVEPKIVPLRLEPSRPSCSFCAKVEPELDALFAGPRVFIGNECIRLCVDILEEERSS